MPKTRAELIAEVADLLNIVGVGETISAEDRLKIDGRIDPKIAELNAREVVNIADVENIEDEYFDALATLVAEATGPSFGVARSKEARDEAENRLREAQGGSWNPDAETEAQYY